MLVIVFSGSLSTVVIACARVIRFYLIAFVTFMTSPLTFVILIACISSILQHLSASYNPTPVPNCQNHPSLQ